MTNRWIAAVLCSGLLALFLAGCPPAGDPPDCEGTPEIIAFEQQVFALINEEREEEEAAPLVHDAWLSEVARCHSEDMLARGFFSHTNPDGEDPFDRLANAGVTYRIAGENVAMLSNYPDPAEGVVEGWMDSAGHRENILRESFTHSGLGVARSGETYYFTQVFIGTGKAGKSALYLSEPLVLTAP